MSEPETLEQIAERLAPPHSEVCRSHASGVCDCWRTRQRIAILAALLEAEALGEQRAARWVNKKKGVKGPKAMTPFRSK